MANTDAESPDMASILESAKSLLDMMGQNGGGEGGDGGGNGGDLERMLNAIETIKTLQTLMERPQPQARPDNTQTEPQSPAARPAEAKDCEAEGIEAGLDARINTPELLTIKAAIPYLERKHQRNLSLLVKLIELQRIMEFYKDAAESTQTGGQPAEGWRERLLASVRQYLEPAKRHKLDIVIKLLEITELAKKIKETEQ